MKHNIKYVLQGAAVVIIPMLLLVALATFVSREKQKCAAVGGVLIDGDKCLKVELINY